MIVIYSIAIFCLLSSAPVYSQVYYFHDWPANAHMPAGARGVVDYTDLGSGTCYLLFPGAVYWFHCENCDIVPEKSKPTEGVYALATPNRLLQDFGSFVFVVNFLQDTVYDPKTVGWFCDPEDTNEMFLYSFPNNMNQARTRSRICDYKLTEQSVLTLDLPADVTDFSVDKPNIFIGGPQLYKIGNIQSWQKEVNFEFSYNGTWFGAADVSIRESKQETLLNESEEEEEADYLDK